MKKTYIQPTMLAVELLQKNQVCQIITASGQNSGGPDMGGEDPNTPDPGAKGSTNVWDEEW